MLMVYAKSGFTSLYPQPNFVQLNDSKTSVMTKSYFLYSSILLLLFSTSCSKDQDETSDPVATTSLSGVWKVDSTVSWDYYDSWSIKSMDSHALHRYNFSMPDRLIRNKSGYIDTILFIQDVPDKEHALADLEPDGDMDTVQVIFTNSGAQAELKWSFICDSCNNLGSKSTRTQYLSK
ncbi:MAG TPA: hypothetical protein DCG19_11645 [Cryomorphaceae bacterium]|nr:hypothetical protein [Owenweeksia sp.]MBG00330.1 hypothetical protein [Owenweeksia sp.]HAD98052.1 hypothetical protein [Cryomorphaceae bacterium]|tara:strand:+ start:401 stop:934 length:534 start_codon:yes stop_codon:yes gene_type:complete